MQGYVQKGGECGGQRAICPASPSLLDEDHPMRIQNLGLLMYGRMDVGREPKGAKGPSGAKVPDETIARAGWSS